MLKPLGARALVKPLDAEATTSGGIILPEAAQERPREGTIVAVGPGANNDAGECIAMSVAVGDVVIYSSYGGTELKVDGEDFLLVNENDIIAVRDG